MITMLKKLFNQNSSDNSGTSQSKSLSVEERLHEQNAFGDKHEDALIRNWQGRMYDVFENMRHAAAEAMMYADRKESIQGWITYLNKLNEEKTVYVSLDFNSNLKKSFFENLDYAESRIPYLSNSTKAEIQAQDKKDTALLNAFFRFIQAEKELKSELALFEKFANDKIQQSKVEKQYLPATNSFLSLIFEGLGDEYQFISEFDNGKLLFTIVPINSQVPFSFAVQAFMVMSNCGSGKLHFGCKLYSVNEKTGKNKEIF